MSVNGKDAAAMDADGLNAAFKRLTAIAEGKSEDGFTPVVFDSDAIDQLSEAADKAKEAYDDEQKTSNMTFAKLAYTRGQVRDVAYMSKGRKYMLVTGLTKKCMAISARASLAVQADTE